MDAVNIGLGVLHVVTGVFFTVTGARKLLLPDVRQKVFGLFASHNVPVPARWAVISGEFFGGLGLLFGCLTQLAALGLLPIMLGAYVMDTWPGIVKKEGGNAPWHKWVSNCLCTPEAQLLVIVVTLAFTGAGALSLDYLLFGRG